MRAEIEHGVHVYDLTAGARAVVKRKSNIPLVTIAIGARGGSHNETAANAGLTGLMARVSIKGTHTRTAAQIAELAENMGGSISPSVAADLFGWQITVPAKHFETALELLCDVAFNATFPEAEFEVERKLALADLHHSRDDMYRFPLRLCMQQAFSGHPYGNTLSAAEASLTLATAESAAAWLRSQSSSWAFVVGDVDPDQAASSIGQRFQNGVAPSHISPSQVAWRGPGRDEDARDKAQTAIALGFPGPARNDQDANVLQVLANAVGGLGGRFFEELRSKRSLAYTVALMPVARLLGGAVIAYIATSPEREAEARAALLEQFDRLRQEVLPANEVERSQRYTIGTWQIQSQTNGAQLNDLLHAYLLGPGIEEIVQYEEQIMAVTPQDILTASQRYFDPAAVVEGIVRGKEQANAE